MHKIVQITDLHLVGPGKQMAGKDPMASTQTALDHIAQYHGDALFIAITGDISDCGAPQAYAQLAQALANYPIPAVLVPGNHDERTALAQAFPQLAGPAGQTHMQQARVAGGHLHLFLDTLHPGHSGGILCAQRLAWLGEQLQAHPDLPVMVYMHHPPFDSGIAAMDAEKLANPDELAATLAPHRARVRHLFTGHLHRPIAGQWQGYSISCCKSPNHQLHLDLSGSQRIYGIEEPPQYLVARFDSSNFLLHFQDYDPRHNPFAVT